MSQQRIPVVIPTHSVIIHKATDDLASSDTVSTAMSVESECSSPCSTEMSVGLPDTEHIGEAALVAKNHAILEGLNEYALAQVNNQNSILPVKYQRSYQLAGDVESASTFLRNQQEEHFTYTTQEIERSLASTQKLLQKFEGSHKTHSGGGLDIWKQLTLSLKELETRSARPKHNVKTKYLHDVDRFKARVATCIQDHSEIFQGDLAADGTDSEMTGISITWSTQRLPTGAIIQKIEEQPRKRRRLSSPDTSTMSRAAPDVCAKTAPLACSISSAASEETENFLDQLEEEVYASILSNLCPDNMRGSFCKAPMTCINKGQFFACPEFAIHQKCPHEKDEVFSHSGFKHTVQSCTANHRNDCKMKHPDGQRCRMKVVFFHIRASCMSVRGDRFVCRTMPCLFGHDNPDIRKAVIARDR